MQNLTDEQAELMASYSSSDTSLPSVTVTADQNYNDGNYNYWDYSPGGGLIGGGGYTDNGPGCSKHTSAPPPATPKNVDLEKLRDLVQHLANDMGAQPYFKTNEQGAFIIREASEELRVTTIQVGGPNGVQYGAQLNAGDVIVASLHSHTPADGSITALPSNEHNHVDGGPGDTVDAARLMKEGTIDPGALYYIVDAATRGTYEYIWPTSDVSIVGSNIATDTVPCG